MLKSKTKRMVLCALFVALITIGAFIRIPVPGVPFTMQLEFVLLAGALLGGKLGMGAVLIYMAMGLLGLPVFAQGGGMSYVLKPSFGYIVGFAVGAYATGSIANKEVRPGMRRLLAANLTGLVIIYLFGMAYYWLICRFYLGTPIGLWPLLLNCFLLLVPGDIVLCVVGAALEKRLLPFIRSE